MYACRSSKRCSPPFLLGRREWSGAKQPLLVPPLSAKDPHYIVKCLLDIDAVPCRSLDKLTAHFYRQCVAFLCRYLPLRKAIAVIANQHDGNREAGGVRDGFLDPLNLAVISFDSHEAGTASDRVDNDESFAVTDPLVSESCVLLLTSCIEDLEHAGIPINHSLLSIRVFDSWVVG